MGIRVIVTGATGMVGEGVLLECLQNAEVERVLVVGRRTVGRTHAKLSEVLVADFRQMDAVSEALRGFDGCFFCAGVSSVGMKEAEYTQKTYDTTMGFAEALVKVSPQAVFVYVSGKSTDGTEKGRSMWARVKGRTENALGRVGFRGEYNFRPGMMKAMDGQRNLPTAYKMLAWLYPVLRVVWPSAACTLEEVGQAMIHAVTRGYSKSVLEVGDIVALAK